jgi:hypothetical protein
MPFLLPCELQNPFGEDPSDLPLGGMAKQVTQDCKVAIACRDNSLCDYKQHGDAMKRLTSLAQNKSYNNNKSQKMVAALSDETTPTVPGAYNTASHDSSGVTCVYSML